MHTVYYGNGLEVRRTFSTGTVGLHPCGTTAWQNAPKGMPWLSIGKSPFHRRCHPLAERLYKKMRQPWYILSRSAPQRVCNLP